MKKDQVKSSVVETEKIQNSPTILGTFEGECADSNITNLNGMDITREVWENVFNSDDYKKAIENHWYIGFLGHPEDPNCMDFEHACIMMTEGHIDENGKVYGKFDLVDTPVGRIVKSFIDAGVTFGISVRGAGDIIDNAVDPDTFVFRGFDLVTFPAFPESIPTFTEIAASTDKNLQAKYKKICASVDKNIDGLNTVDSINIVQSCFAKQSDTYRKLEARKQSIMSSTSAGDDIDITSEQLTGMTHLYIQERNKAKVLSSQLAEAKRLIASMEKDNKRKIQTMQRITSAQLADMDKEVASIAKDRNRVHREKAQAIAASNQLKSDVESLKRSNLNYKRKIESTRSDLKEKDSVIASLQLKLNETVSQVTQLEDKVSNLDTTNRQLNTEIFAAQKMEDANANLRNRITELEQENSSLRSKIESSNKKTAELEKSITAATKLVEEYQDAYAGIYANAIGVQVDSIPVTSSTSVAEMQGLLNRSMNPIQASHSIEPTPIEIDDLGEDDDETLVTM